MTRLLLALAILAIALFLQLYTVEAVGVSVNLVFGALIAAAFFLNPLEVITCAAIAIFFLFAGSVPDIAMLFFAFTPFIVLWVRKVISFERWLAAGALAILGVLVSYIFFGPNLFLSHISWVLADVLLAGVYAALSVFILEGLKSSTDGAR